MKRDPVTGFKVKFNILDYSDITPDIPEDFEQIINWDKPAKESVWRKIVPEVITPEYIQQEMERVLRTGVWIFINLQPLWIPPNYYFFLQYGTVGDDIPEFRLKRLKQVYFKLRIRNNPAAIGTYTIKCRQDGETTSAIHDALWEMLDGNMHTGQIGIQSKTNDDAKNPCWLTVKTVWGVIPSWFKQIFYSDFTSEGAMEQRIKFERPASEGVKARSILMTYYPSVHNAMDGKNNMRRCILDEVNKWKECSFYDTYINYKKFIAVGSSRRGLFDIFSSPSDVNGKWNDEALLFWKGSNPDELTATGSTATRVFRYYSNPLEGIQGFYDEFGDADSEDIYSFIIQERVNLPKDKQLAEIRAFPLNENEMFGSYEASSTFSNTKGIAERITFLTGIRFKDEYSQEPVKIYGNLDRIGGYMDGEVEFRASDRNDFDLHEARFCFSYFPQNKQPLRDVFTPPGYVENSLGVDPFNFVYHRKDTKRQSNGAMVNRKFLDIHSTGIKNIPTMIYCCRPQHIDTFYQDIIKAAIFNRAKIQIENKTDGFAKYAEEHGYLKWLLPTRGETESSKRFGDSPQGNNGFLNEGLALINANTNTPLREGDPYLLEQHWFDILLQDYLNLDPLDTQKSDLTMADIQSLIGAVKMLSRPARKAEAFNQYAINYLLS